LTIDEMKIPTFIVDRRFRDDGPNCARACRKYTFQALALGQSRIRIRENSHGNRKQCNTHRNTPDSKKAVANTLTVDPPIDVERQPKGEHVLDKIHGRKGFASLFPMTVDNVSDDPGGS
jgi:hypothetical protein